MLTSSQAINQITSGMSVSQLRALANQVDASVGSQNTLLLYSGGVGEIGADGKNEFGAGEISKSLSEKAILRSLNS